MLVQDQRRYNTGAIVLHWLIAFALAVELAVGFGMPHDASGFAAFQFHKSLGLTILLLTFARIGWRLTYKSPPALDTGLMALAAKLGHLGLYAFMLLAPLTGWAIVSTSEIEVPTMLWGVIPWPHLPLDKAMSHTFEEAHEIIAFVGIALFVGHVLAALWHQKRLLRASIGYMLASLRGYALGGRPDPAQLSRMPEELHPLADGIGDLEQRMNAAYDELRHEPPHDVSR